MVTKTMTKYSGVKDNETSNAMDEVNGKEKVPADVLVIAQEIKIVKSLACNNLVKRNRQLKKLKNWMELRSQSSYPFKKDDYERIWHGLYYTMWMSDKPLVQEDLAEQLGQLLNSCGNDVKQSVDFFGAFLQTMCRQWYGIDQWRIDKFMMLVRRMLRYMLRVLKASNWKVDDVQRFNGEVQETVLNNNIRIGATGLTMHYLDIFCEELAKVANGQIDAEQVGEFMQPFVVFYCTQTDLKLASHCRTRIFYHMLYQSELGRAYMEKYNAWKEMGFPTSSIEDLELIANPEEDNTEEYDESNAEDKNKQRFLDPRAGSLDVFVPELPLDGKYIVEGIQSFIQKFDCNTKRRKMFRKLEEVFQNYCQGKFPLGIKNMPRANLPPSEEVVAEQIAHLDDTEKELYSVGRDLKKLNKRKRKKLLKSLNFDDVDEDRFDETIKRALTSQKHKNSKQLNKRKLKRKLETVTNKWIEEELDTGEVATPNKKKKISAAFKEMLEEAVDENIEAEKAKDWKTENNHAEISGKSACDEPLAIATSNKKKRTSVAFNEMLEKPMDENKEAEKAKYSNSEDNNAGKSGKSACDEPFTSVTPSKKKRTSAAFKETIEKAVDENIEAEKANSSKLEDNNAEVSGKSAWDEPLAEGEIEYFIPSKKATLQRANESIAEQDAFKTETEGSSNKVNNKTKNKSCLVLNPLAMKKQLGSAASSSQAVRSLQETNGPANDVTDTTPTMPTTTKKKHIKTSLALNPLAMKKKYCATVSASTPVAAIQKSTSPSPNVTPLAQTLKTPKTPTSGRKRVKIALKLNSAQHPSEYYRQLKVSPQIPYDANKKPSKGLLKPNSMPTPINPFYKKKIGLRLLNDTM